MSVGRVQARFSLHPRRSTVREKGTSFKGIERQKMKVSKGTFSLPDNVLKTSHRGLKIDEEVRVKGNLRKSSSYDFIEISDHSKHG